MPAERGEQRQDEPAPLAQLAEVELAARLEPDDEEEERHQAAVHPLPQVERDAGSPTSIDRIVLQNESYECASMLIQRSAAAAATSSTAAPPISVSTNSRRGVCRLRAQAVRPE